MLGGSRVTSSSPLPRAQASSALASLNHFHVKEDIALVFSLVVQSLMKKKRTGSVKSQDSLSPSATRNTKRNVASSSKHRRRPLQKLFFSMRKLTDTATGIDVDENQLISWARTNRPQKEVKKND